MQARSVRKYLKHYGKIKSLRKSNLQTTFRRVVAEFDVYDETHVNWRLREVLGLDPDALKCVFCRSEKATCWDHLVPAAQGGTHQLRNLAPACSACNAKKGNKHWREFFASIGVPESDPNWVAMEAYTADYVSGATFITGDERRQLAEKLEAVVKLLAEADDIVARALTRRKPSRAVLGDA